MELFSDDKTSISKVLDELESKSSKTEGSIEKKLVWTLEIAKREGLVKENANVRDRKLWENAYRSFGTLSRKDAISCKNYLQSKELKFEARQAAILEVQKARVSESEYQKKLKKREEEREMERQVAEMSKKQKKANVRSYRRVTNIY
jgi:hypothetical protein